MNQKHIFLFDPFGLDGLKHFIMQDGQKIVDKIFFGTKKMTRTDIKITLCKIQFNLNACKNLSKKELDSLSETVNFFSFYPSFWKQAQITQFCKYLDGRR